MVIHNITIFSYHTLFIILDSVFTLFSVLVGNCIIVCKQHMSVLSQHHREGRTDHYSMAELGKRMLWDHWDDSVLVLIQDCYRHTHTLYDYHECDTQT